MSNKTVRSPNFYGRRRGHKLRSGRQKLLSTLLPKLRTGIGSSRPVDVTELFSPPKKDLWMEVGFGAGEHLAHQACQYPDIGFIGVEPYANGMATLLAEIKSQNLKNIRLFDDDVRLLLPYLPDQCLGRMFILFSDPWPKKRHHRRRVFSRENLMEFGRVLRSGAILRFSSDDMSYIRQALDIVQRHTEFRWCPEEPSDWRGRPEDAIETRYESKARLEGQPSVYLTFIRSGS